MTTASIIGSGVAGLSTAIRLANKGIDVTVFEQNDKAGGKINEIRESGFRFDTGPSLFTLPQLTEELFELCNEPIEAYLNYQRVDPICKYFYADNVKLNAWADSDKFAKELQDKAQENPEKVLAFLKKYKWLYELTAPVFLENSFHKLRNFSKPAFIRALFNLHKMDTVSSMYKRNKKWFESSHTSQLFNRYATYNGSNPYVAPATLNVIAHLEHNLGAYLPEKGMYQIADALYKLALNQGVQFKFNSKVSAIELSKNSIESVTVNQQKIKSDLVVCNADIRSFYNYLLPNFKKPKSIIKNDLSSSGIILYWGINKLFPDLELHNILFAEDYKKEFDSIFKLKNITNDPTVYIYISSKKIKEDAPEGKENWFVMINTPPNHGQDWNKLIEKARKSIIKKINKQLNTNIENHIEFEHIGSPISIEQKTSSWKGALYGNNSNGIFSAFNRHPNFSKIFKNLYFVGGSVHPGGGIPLCLNSAKIVSELIKN